MKKSQRIAVVANIRLPVRDAGARRVMSIVEAFTGLGHQIGLYAPCPRERLNREDFVAGCTFHWGAYPSKSLQWCLRDRRVPLWIQARARISWIGQILGDVIRRKYDWIYFYQPTPETLFMAAFVRFVGLHICIEQVDGIKYTLPKFSFFDFLYYLMYRNSTTIAKRLADQVIVISSILETESKGCRRVMRVPALVDCIRFQDGNRKKFRNQLSGIRKKRWVVYTGSLNSPAGFTILMTAMRKVVLSAPDAHLVFAGPAPYLSELPTVMIEKNKLKQSAVYLGLLNQREVIDLLAAADVLVMPKASSTVNDAGFPTKLAEYMASGTPVVATKVSDIGEYLIDGKHAFLCLPGNVNALANAIITALDATPETMDDMSKSAQQLAMEIFDVNVNCCRIIEAMDSI